MKMKTGIEFIAEERKRQVEAEGWTPEHDDQHSNGELVKAALCYGLQVLIDNNAWIGSNVNRVLNFIVWLWPWRTEWFKPSVTVRNLTKAGALFAAEIDRLQRLEKKESGNVCENCGTPLDDDSSHCTEDGVWLCTQCFQEINGGGK